MANIPQNDSYTGSPGAKLSNSQWIKLRTTPLTPSTTQTSPVQGRSMLNYIPRVDYGKFLPELPPPTENAVPGTEDYYNAQNLGVRQYGKLVNEGMGIPVGQQFMPPIANELAIPEDYGVFAKPTTIQNETETLSWGTPKKPVLKSMEVGDSKGQYVMDEENRDQLVKTVRGRNDMADAAILNGRPSFMYQVDHVIPLALGGADTLANREVLTNTEHSIKTKAQSIPYTLYAAGDISLTEARIMALQWRDHDLSDIPDPDKNGIVPSVGNKTGLEIAREMKDRWHEKKVGFKEVMAEIPQTTKDLGKGVLPDFAREFIKGFENQATFGFIPYEQGEGQDWTGWLGGKVGQITGGVASFVLLGGFLRAASTGIKALRGVSSAAAARAGFNIAGAAEGAATKKAIGTTFSTLNKTPGYVERILKDEALRARVGRSAGLSVLSGQAQQFVSDKFNPYVLAGEQEVTSRETGEIIGGVFRDLALGSIYGVPSPTIKGVAQATTIPMVMGFWMNPDDPTAALVDGVAFGAMHYAGARKQPGFNDIKAFGGKPYESPVLQRFNDAVDRTMYSSLSNYAPELMPQLKANEKVPSSAKTYEATQAALDKSIESIVKRAFFGQSAAPETVQSTIDKLRGYSSGVNKKIDKFGKTEGSEPGFFSSRKTKKEYTAAEKKSEAEIKKEFGPGYTERLNFRGDIETGAMDLQSMLNEVKRVTIAARQLYKGGLVGELRGVADVNDLSSFAKANQEKRFAEQEKYVSPPIARQAVDAIDNSIMDTSFAHFNEPAGGKGRYPSGTVAVTGFGLDQNNPRVSAFLKLLDNPTTAKDVSPNLIVVDRPDTGSLWRLKNQFTDKKMIESGISHIDNTPENAAQVFGIKWKRDASGNVVGKELVDLGWIASEHRRQTGANAFNQHPAVKKFIQTNGAEGLRPIDFNKDDVVGQMRKMGMRVMIMNLDKASTSAAKESGKSFVMGNVNEQNWLHSKILNEKLKLGPNEDSLSMSLARLRFASTPAERNALIEDIKKKNIDSASERIPVPPPTSSQEVVTAVESKRVAMRSVDSVLSANTPEQLKTDMLDKLGILVEDAKAKEIFSKKETITEKEIVDVIVDSVNGGRATVEGRINAEAIKLVEESGIMKLTPLGSISSELPVKGKRPQQQIAAEPEGRLPLDTPPQETLTSISATPNFGKKQESVSAVSTTPTIVSNKQPSELTDKIVSSAVEIKRDPTQPGPVTVRRATPEELGNSLPEKRPYSEKYEVSSAGDKRFSALNARFKNGKTIEQAYQEAKGAGKGMPSPDPNFKYWDTYKGLWRKWAQENPKLIEELRYLSRGKTLNDKFAKTENNQAKALTEILEETAPREKESVLVGADKETGSSGQLITPTEAMYEQGVLPWETIKQAEYRKSLGVSSDIGVNETVSSAKKRIESEVSAAENRGKNQKIMIAENDFFRRAKIIIEETNPRGGGKYNPINPETGEVILGHGAEDIARKMIKSIKKLEPSGVSKDEAAAIKKGLNGRLLYHITDRISNIFDMPYKDAAALIKRLTTPRMGMEKEKPIFGASMPEDFFAKDITGKSKYDILKERRQKSGEEVVRFAKTGLKKAEPGTYEHAFSYTLNKWLSEKFGKNYEKSQDALQYLGRAMGTERPVSERFKGLYETTNTKGMLEPFTQPKDYLDALAIGNRTLKEVERIKRKKALQERQDEDLRLFKEGESMFSGSDELTRAGIRKGEMVGMRIENPIQDENMVKDMAVADFKLNPGLSSIVMGGKPDKGAAAIRRGINDARNIAQEIMKQHNDQVGAGKKGMFLTLTPNKLYTGKWSTLTDAAKKKVNEAGDKYFDDIYKEYVTKGHAWRKKTNTVSEALKQVSELKKVARTVKEGLDNPEERQSWQTRELFDDILDKIRYYNKIMKEAGDTAKRDGSGGPGYDGRGGFWSSLGNFISHPIETIKNAWSDLNKPYTMNIKQEENTGLTGSDGKPFNMPSISQQYPSLSSNMDGLDTYKPPKNEEIKIEPQKESQNTYQIPSSNQQIQSGEIKPFKVPHAVPGTNYDPYDPKQNRPDSKPEDIGRGADGIFIDDSMVASSWLTYDFKKDKGLVPTFRLGTILYIPELNKKFLVADLKGSASTGTNTIDFATPHQGGKVFPEYNKPFEAIVLRKGQGYGDARQLVKSGEWERIKNEPVVLPDSL